MKSKRQDKRGHWEKGKRRNPVGGWNRIRRGIQSLLDNHATRGVISFRAIAAAVGVDDRTVRRWMSGEDVPSTDSAALAKAWLSDTRKTLKQKKK